MSGETYIFSTESYEITKDNFLHNVRGSNFQLSSLNFNDIVKVPEYTDNKVLTEKKKEKLINKYENLVDSLMKRDDKYSFKGALLGVVSFDKMKPVFTKVNSHSFTKSKGSKIDGYCVLSSRFATLTEAKKSAKAIFMRTSRDTYISKCYVDKYGRKVGEKRVLVATGEFIGEMKSRPTKTPKSYVVRPKYLYVIEFTLVDAEYEWM